MRPVLSRIASKAKSLFESGRIIGSAGVAAPDQQTASFATVPHLSGGYRALPAQEPRLRARDADQFIEDRFTSRDLIEYNINYATEVLQEYFPEVNLMHINIPNVEYESKGLFLKTLESQKDALCNGRQSYLITTVRGIDVGHHEGDPEYRRRAHHAVLIACEDFSNPNEPRFFYDINGADGYGGAYKKVMDDLKDDLAVFNVGDGCAAKVVVNESRSTVARGVCAQGTLETLVRALESGKAHSIVDNVNFDDERDLKDLEVIENKYERDDFIRNNIARKVREMNGLKKYMIDYRDKMEDVVKSPFPTSASRLKEKTLEQDLA